MADEPRMGGEMTRATFYDGGEAQAEVSVKALGDVYQVVFRVDQISVGDMPEKVIQSVSEDEDCGCPENAELNCISVVCPRKEW